MDPRKLAALAKKNAAKSGTTSKIPKNFGKKYDPHLRIFQPTKQASSSSRKAIVSSRK